MPSNLKAEDIIWDDNDIVWDEPEQAPQAKTPSMAAQVLGYPVDVVNNVLGWFGLGSDAPIMGSKYLGQAFDFSPEGLERKKQNLASSPVVGLMGELQTRTDAMLRGEEPKPLSEEGMKSALETGMASVSTTPQTVTMLKPSPEAVKNLAIADRAGIELTGPMAKGKKFGVLAESTAGKTLTGSLATQSRLEGIKTQIDDFANRVSPTRGTGIANQYGGERAATEFAKRLSIWKKLQDRAYGNAFKELPKGTTLPKPLTNKVASEIADELAETQIGTFGNVQTVASKLRDAEGVGNQTINGLILDQRWLKEAAHDAIQRGANTEAMYYTRLWNAIDQDLDNFSNQIGGKFSQKYREATKLASQGDNVLPGANVFYNTRVKALLQTKDPAQIADAIFKPRNIKELKMFRQAVGVKGWKGLQDAWVERLFDKATSGGEVGVMRFQSNYLKYDKQTLDLITQGNPVLRRNLDDLAEIGRIMRKYEQLGGNPSGSGQVVGALAQMGQVGGGLGGGALLASGHPVAAVITTAATLGTPYLIGKFTTGRTIIKLAKNGLKMSPSSSQALQVAKRLAIALGVDFSYPTQENIQ